MISYLFTYLLGGSGSGQTTLSCKDIYESYDADDADDADS